MAEYNLESIIKSGVEKALNTPVHGGKTISEWAAIGMKNGGGWINVKDRLPEKEGKYLVFTSDFASIRTAMFTLSLKRRFDYTFEDGEPDRPGFYNWDSEDDWIQDDVTHWMPLPEPPTKEGMT